MISKRIQFMKDADLRGELLEVINTWEDNVEAGEYGIDKQDRLNLVDRLFDFLSGKPRG